MVSNMNMLTLILLCALVAAATSQASQGGAHQQQWGPPILQEGNHVFQSEAHENQGKPGIFQGKQSNEDASEESWKALVPCDIEKTPLLSCQDCNTRLICKPFGGIVKACRNPMKPYCNRGICSFMPGEGCEQNNVNSNEQK